jgi:hypothetical protein
MKKILFKSLIIVILLIFIFVLPDFYQTGVVIYFRLFLLLLIFMESLSLFKNIFIDNNVNKIISNAATVLLSFFLIFIFLEALFMFIPRSHSSNYTLASRLWYAKYWKPINSLGFRDNEPDYNHPIILFVGDSFTSGAGLNYIDDRFSNIVDRNLNIKKKKFSVVNIGRIGIDTMDEYYEMKTFIKFARIKPKVIILQYDGNDIQNTALKSGLFFPNQKNNEMNAFIETIGSQSYLFNYIYWLFPRNLEEPYLNLLYRVYRNDQIVLKHKGELKLFVDYARNNSILLIVVVFPFLENIEFSNRIYVDTIVDFFQTNHIDTINVSQLVKDIPVSERIINKNDGHASKKVNKIVAQEILKIIGD